MIDWIISCIRGKLEKPVPRRTGKDYDLKAFDDLCWLADHKKLSHPDIPYTYDKVTSIIYKEALLPALERIDDKNDCADFTALRLIHLVFETKNFLYNNPDILELIEKTLTGFSFWIEDSRNDSMCYYSENHQICFAAVEYLSGVLFHDKTFACDGKTGKEHVRRAMERMEIWFALRHEFGFSEFMSSNYLPIDISALSALVMHAEKRIADLAAQALDILMDDYAFGFFKYTFINASGRDYPGNLAGTKERSMNSAMIMSIAFGNNDKYLFERGRAANFFLKAVSEGCYKVKDETVRRAFTCIDEVRHFGLNTADYGKHDLLKGDTRSLMMQLGSGALTNPAVIDQTYETIERLGLWHHDFVHWLRFLDWPLLRRLGLMPGLSRLFNYFQNGMSLESADVHVIRRDHYKISLLENYFPGSFGAQKNTLAVTLDNKTSFYINHPLRPCPKDGADIFPFDTAAAPSYFGGYNIAPAAVAKEDTVLMIYRLPIHRGTFAPCKIIRYTHAYFDRSRYDEVILKCNRLFARAGESYMAVLGRNELELSSPDLIQKGRHTFWIVVLSDTDKESFTDFIKRIESIPVFFDGKQLRFGDKELIYKKELM